MTEESIFKLLYDDLNVTVKNVVKLPNYDQIPYCIGNVIIDMTFNMGPGFLTSWPNFFAQLANKDYKAAADNIASSKWCG